MLKERRTLDITHSNLYQVRAQLNNVTSNFNQSAWDNIGEPYGLHGFESDAEHFEFMDSLVADNNIFFLLQSMWKVLYVVQIQRRECRKLLRNGQHPLYPLVETILRFICIKFYPGANSRTKQADGFYNSMIDDKEGHIPSPRTMFTCI